MAIAPDHPLAARPRGITRSSRLSSRNAARSAHRSRRSRRRKRRATTRGSGSSTRSIPSGGCPVYVANFILMDYGTGAIFGCPAHDQRDLDFVNVYGLGATPVVCPPGVDPATFTVDTVAYDGDGLMINSRFLDGMTIEDGQGRGGAAARGGDDRQSPAGQAPGQFQAARLGHLAPALLGLSDPDHPLRALRRRARSGEGSAGAAAGGRDLRSARQSARPPSDLEARRLPAVRRPCAARDRHDGHVRRFVVVFRPLHRSDQRDGADRPRGRQPLAAGRSVHRRHRACDPASALFALLHPGDAQVRPSRARRAVRRALHPGHGGARDLSRRGRAVDRAERGADRRRRRRAARGADRHRRADRDRPGREDVEVEAQYGRPRRDHRDLRRRHGALVHAVRFAARARRDLDRGRRPGRLQADAAAVAARLRDRARRRRRAPGRDRRRSATKPAASGRSPMRRWPRSRTRSSGCASTSASPRSTNSPMRCRPRSARSRRRRSPTTCAGPSPKPATSSSTASPR